MRRESADDELLGQLQELVSRYRPAKKATLAPATTLALAEAEQARAVKAKAIYRARRLRDCAFGDDADLFADPAWDILLDLYVARRRGLLVSVSSACIAASVPPTTGLRWVYALEHRGLLVRRPDAGDRRRFHVELTDKAMEMMDIWLSGMAVTSAA